MTVEIGQRPPSFHLPSGQGPEIGPDAYRGQRKLIVWFTKGMACPFCRVQMSRLARAYDQIKALGAEVLQVTPTRPERARFYVQNFRIPFPYLCDPDYETHRAWGIDVRSHSLAWYAKTLVAASRMPKPSNEIGDPKPALGEFPGLLHDTDMGFFVLDREGTVRYRRTGAYIAGEGPREIPSTDEIVQELQRAA